MYFTILLDLNNYKKIQIHKSFYYSVVKYNKKIHKCSQRKCICIICHNVKWNRWQKMLNSDEEMKLNLPYNIDLILHFNCPKMIINLVKHFVSLVCAASSIDPSTYLISPAWEVSSPVNFKFVRNELRARSTVTKIKRRYILFRFDLINCVEF